MNKLTLLLLIVILVLLGAVAFLGINLVDKSNDLKTTKQFCKVQQMNANIVGFTNLFITKVLQSDKELSFEDRIAIENAVREIGNQDILDQWQKFLSSKTEAQAQAEVKNLLEVLVKNISS